MGVTHLFKFLNVRIQEQIEWARDGGADYIIAETIHSFAEAVLALEACKETAPGSLCFFYNLWYYCNNNNRRSAMNFFRELSYSF